MLGLLWRAMNRDAVFQELNLQRRFSYCQSHSRMRRRSDWLLYLPQSQDSKQGLPLADYSPKPIIRSAQGR